MDLSGLPNHRSKIRSYSFLGKDGSLWFCVNSRDPNNLTIKEPMLSAHDWRTSELPGPYQTLCFIQLDRSTHYGKKTHNGRLKYQTMHFPTIFQGCVNKTLAEKFDVFV